MDKKVSIITHSGSFHPDDVFAVGALLFFLEGKGTDVRVIRSREADAVSAGDFVVDVGGVYDEMTNRFDHHQPEGAGVRPNGVPYAAFGLVWKKYGAEISGSVSVADALEVLLVQPIDYGDNLGLPLSEIVSGIYPYTIDRLISAFGNTYEEKDRNVDEVFLEIVAFAKKLLLREITKARALEHAKTYVERAYREAEDKRIVVLDAEYPWYPVLSKFPEPLFVAFPDGKSGNWGVLAVRKDMYRFENRKDFPNAWAGKRDAELREISGVPDAVFCHNNLFFAVAKTRAGALALAQKALTKM